jgi:DNA-formamidopyrimidine glycosylase
MPESAEVKLTTEYLQSKLENKIITDWVFIGGKYENKYPDGFEDFEYNLPLIVENVQCKGKFIYMTVFNEDGYFYILHSLRMTGRWQDYEDHYCRWYIETNDKNIIWFRNPRCFATLEFSPDNSVLTTFLSKLGPDILTEEFTLPIWKQIVLKHKNKNITALLMNQKILSGIGNYIKSEVLFYAKISPLRKTSSLSNPEIEKLYEAIRIIPRISYNKKGLSISDYADSGGRKGSYEKELKIYRKPHSTKTKTSDGRMTYWDPDIQE